MPAQRKYPDELRERAMRMVLEIRARSSSAVQAVTWWPDSSRPGSIIMVSSRTVRCVGRI